ncbi:LOW QUALITY PROTEIN: hypothetical protein ACHAXT_000529 [Thalassiosira profunda]
MMCGWSGRLQSILLVAALLQWRPHFVTAFLAPNIGAKHQSILIGKFSGNDETDDDGDEPAIKPYRNRSLYWTLNYRKANPYEKARARVLGFGHRSKDDWDEARAQLGQSGQYVPSYPDEMYAPEWVSWDEWLGLMRSYSETKNLATNILGLKSLDDYLLFVKSNSKRAEGLRIPVRPDIFYKDEWTDEESFFGK